jgi:GntR family transcriptional regulator
VARGTRTTGRAAPIAAVGSPRYHQVYVGLRAWVRDGVYRAGQQIPTEAELCQAFEVSRITVRKAVDELVREGWLVRSQGRGTFVASFASRAAASVDLREALHYVADLGAATEVRGSHIAEVVPDEETRAALQLEGEIRVQRETHVRLMRGTPLGAITTFVPLEIARRVAKLKRRSTPLLERLQLAGVRVGEAEQWIGATLADVETARLLGVKVGAPILRVVRTVFDRKHLPVERVIALYRADAYVYRLRIAPPASRRRK